jgi:hypothetical protein
MKSEGSLPCSQEPTTGPCSEPDESSPHTKPNFLKIDLNISVISDMRATCPAHIIILYFITLIISGEEYEVWGSSLCSFLRNLITLFSNNG